ncbi:protein phosphatase type 1 complex subunit Hex2/Reg1 [Phlyctema vagabunda]|uniref:Protein phosphatase type 1 complex subunit Hex2/Reg1 n=1 Tax=Phlyctema vagabunda TaxID=108571 RepID=A0ABR4PQ32_9HELO
MIRSLSESSVRPAAPLFVGHAKDDAAVSQTPAGHVDYLSHVWKEEDLWSSWRHLVSAKKTTPVDIRLENASWRAWSKISNNLHTINPARIDWQKDSDSTWLYGPHQTRADSFFTTPIRQPAVESTPEPASPAKRPILKKLSMAEIMLRRSLSTLSLLRQAASTVQIHQYDFGMHSTIRNHSNHSSPRPHYRKKRIHFNQQVEQRRPCADASCETLAKLPSIELKHPELNEKPQPQAVNYGTDLWNGTFRVIHHALG